MMKSSNTGKTLKNFFNNPSTPPFLILIAVVVVLLFAQDNFLRWSTIYGYINSFAPLILLTMGQAVVIVSGGLDMSSGASLAVMVCALTKIMHTDQPITGVYAMVVVFLMAIGIGLVNGISVGYFRLPAVIATYATSFLWQGMAQFITPSPGGQAVDWFRGFYNFSYVKGLEGMGDIVPPALLLIIVGCIIWSVIKRCKLGRYIYAVGSNYEAAFHSGINSTMIQVKAYIINALMIYLAALFYAAQNAAGNSSMGDTLTLQTIAAAIVGGIAMAGGRGNIHIAIVGALIMSFIGRVIYYLNVPSSYQTLVSGIIVIVAIAAGEIVAISQRKAELKGAKSV